MGFTGLIAHSILLLYKHYKFKTEAQLVEENDSCLNVLAHVSMLYLHCTFKAKYRLDLGEMSNTRDNITLSNSY